MGIIDAIASGFKLAWALVTGRNAQAERANTPEMQANVKAGTDAAVADKASATVGDAMKTGNLDELRKEAAE